MAKASMRERYTELTRGLAWDPTYVTHEELYPHTRFEGIKIHDWDAWEDPFRLTVDAYHKYQTEKDKRLYAVLDSFAQGSGSPAGHGRSLLQLAAVVPPRRDSAGVRSAPAFRVPRPSPRRPGPTVRLSLSEHRRTTPQPDRNPRDLDVQQVLRRTAQPEPDARSGLVSERAKVVLRRRHLGGPVRVHDRNLFQLRVFADQSPFRAVHERRQF